MSFSYSLVCRTGGLAEGAYVLWPMPRPACGATGATSIMKGGAPAPCAAIDLVGWVTDGGRGHTLGLGYCDGLMLLPPTNTAVKRLERHNK